MPRCENAGPASLGPQRLTCKSKAANGSDERGSEDDCLSLEETLAVILLSLCIYLSCLPYKIASVIIDVCLFSNDKRVKPPWYNIVKYKRRNLCCLFLTFITPPTRKKDALYIKNPHPPRPPQSSPSLPDQIPLRLARRANT